MLELPLAHFEGNIVVVDTLAMAQKVSESLMQEYIVGIDTETKPAFVVGKRYNVSLLQIATEDQYCYLFRLNKIGLPSSLVQFLENGQVLKIGLSLHDDIVGLKRLSSFAPSGFVELQRLAPAYGLQCSSLQKLYAILCSRYMSKKQRLTNWEASELSLAQKQYASLDAYATLEIYSRLLSLPNPTPIQFGLVYEE